MTFSDCLCLEVTGLERFVCRVFQGGKVTVPRAVRDLLGIVDGVYVRLEVVEVITPGVKQKSKKRV